MSAKFIFVTGGVVSSLGKGIAAASLGTILQSMGKNITIRKLDPYLNVDPGTINPIQHGEVFVTEDGGETDLDLGHYERFTGNTASKLDNITSGKIYQTLIEKERRGDYLGQTVQVIPHVTDLIKDFILNGAEKYDFIICEIGGTVGDIEGQPFLEAIRQLSRQLGRQNTMFIHTTLLPYVMASEEVKTKPTQHSVKALMYHGIEPDLLLCRTNHSLAESDKKKIAMFCNVAENNVIEAPNVDNIYKIPAVYAKNQLGEAVLLHFGCTQELPSEKYMNKWIDLAVKLDQPTQEIKIAIVGKYTKSQDAYKSVIQALMHAGMVLGTKVSIEWINAINHNPEQLQQQLKSVNGILVPGGFGTDGVEMKMLAIKYAREHKIPFFGICYGMQLAVIEFCRNVLGIKATSGEWEDQDSQAIKVVNIMQKWINGGKEEIRPATGNMGGTMRLGSYPAKLKPNSLAAKIYQAEVIHERHRHRYEVDLSYTKQIEAAGGIFSGLSLDGLLPELFELSHEGENAHPFFIGCQFHPEFTSKPFKPNPIFAAFVEVSSHKPS